jgi:hypothetical protein
MFTSFMAWLSRLLHWDTEIDPLTPSPMPPPNTPSVPQETPPVPKSEVIYQAAKDSLGTKMTLNSNVPSEVGCAEAISAVLKKAAIAVPAGGIAGTAALFDWLPQNGFHAVSQPLRGDIIVSPTGRGNGSVRGHTGVIGVNGILSNDSSTGLFLELWTLPAWQQWYGDKGGLPVAFFRWG